ncbi:DNA-binding transcriptional MerR regulator [Mycobacterium sp. MAA66]|uniref:MerR family transcriptional regulator n=1 Tax=Mycobacterium sp. MAA66 TaxID=3156297 RepID=UPI003513ABDE
MRISELSEQSGVTVATIKYYLREGLLTPGSKVSQRQADYGELHLARLQLLRVLREVGDIPVADLKKIVDAVQNESLSIHQMFGATYDALARSSDALNEPDRALAAQVVEKAGWTDVRSDAPVLDQLAGLLGVLNDLGWPFDLPNAATYLGLIDAIAAYEVSRLTAAELQADRDAVVQQMVIGQVVFGQLLLNLRRLAHEHHSALRFNEHVDIEK